MSPGSAPSRDTMKRIWRLLRGRRTQVELTVSMISGGEELRPEEQEEENNVAPAPSLSPVPPESSSKTLEQELEKYKKALAEKTAALNRAETKLCLVQREEKKGHALEVVRDQEGGDAIRKAEELQQELANLQRENLSLHHRLDDAWYKDELEHLVSDAFPGEADTAESGEGSTSHSWAASGATAKGLGKP